VSWTHKISCGSRSRTHFIVIQAPNRQQPIVAAITHFKLPACAYGKTIFVWCYIGGTGSITLTATALNDENTQALIRSKKRRSIFDLV